MGNLDPTGNVGKAAERTIMATRRGAVRTAARLTVATGLVLTGVTVRDDHAGAAQATTGDFEVVTQLLAAEKTAYALLRDGLTQFTSDKSTSGDRNMSTQPTLARIAQHDGRHLSLLAEAAVNLGTDALPGSPPGFAFADFAAFLRQAAELKQQMVASYVLAVTRIDDVTLRSLVARILAVEARHAAYLNARIGEAPFWAEQEDLQGISNPLMEDAGIAN